MFEIHPLDGKDMLEQIMKEQKGLIKEFPIVCKTQEEAEEKLRMLLGGC